MTSVLTPRAAQASRNRIDGVAFCDFVDVLAATTTLNRVEGAHADWQFTEFVLPDFERDIFLKVVNKPTPARVVSNVIDLRRWARVRQVIEQWKSLPLDWDGDDTPQLGERALERIEALARLGADQCIPEPQPFFAADGEIGLRWKRGSLRAAVSFPPDGTVVAFCAVPGAAPISATSSAAWATVKAAFLKAIGQHY